MKRAGSIILAVLLLSGQGCAGRSGHSGKTEIFSDVGTEIILVKKNGLMWQRNKGPRVATWQEAKEYAENLQLGGYSDWRLPSSEELLDLHFMFDFGAAREAEYGFLVTGDYWCVDRKDGVVAGSWDEMNLCEIDRKFEGSTKGYVRAVRP